MPKELLLRLLICALLSLYSIRSARGQVLVFERQSEWRFSSRESGLGWTLPQFDDKAWSKGSAPLGFGEPDIATETYQFRADTDVPIANQFRTDFESLHTHEGTLRLKIRADDGFIAFLNGEELTRWNVPAGPLLPGTMAIHPLSSPEEQLYRQFDVPGVSLRRGKNILAIEVRQCNARSTDLCLDVRLSLLHPTSPQLVQANGMGLALSLAFNSTHTISEETRIPDGFVDGGREMQIDEFGYVASSREILRVDREHDPLLRKHLHFATDPQVSSMNAIARAARIARYIDECMTPSDGRGACEARSDFLAVQYKSQEILLGDVLDLCGAGVCRHRALLFKVMADEAGLKARLVRGRYGTSDQQSGHTWNELLLDDGRILIVDVMNPAPDFVFPEVSKANLTHYRTVAGSLKYSSKD